MPKRFHVTSLLMPNPPNGKRVMRPSRWGNPFTIKAEGSAAAALPAAGSTWRITLKWWRWAGGSCVDSTSAAPGRSESPAMPMSGWRW